MKIALLIYFSFFLVINVNAQEVSLSGNISTPDGNASFATVQLQNTSFGSLTDENGFFEISSIPVGEYILLVEYVGYQTFRQQIEINQENQEFNIQLVESNLIDEVVITGTRTERKQIESPIMVNVLNAEQLKAVQACTISEGLRFQPGLRVENNCQTCNYTQLRMNGLAGGYSQILINGRPIFSPLTGLYGLEQIPTNMVDRIEVVRGGASSLYGSSAIGGTVNVITKIPTRSGYEIDYSFQSIGGDANDHNISANATLVNDNDDAGVSFFINRREREYYDANGDNFSEIPELQNTALGANFFLLPNENQKFELSVSNLTEFRYGGEMVDVPAFLAQQTEERDHNVWMANIDYQINFNEDNSSLIAYAGFQNTNRDHYTGILPDDPTALSEHNDNPPYGASLTTTVNTGVQFNHRLQNFIKGNNVITIGAEYIGDEILDEIVAYNYLIDQTTRNGGFFVQSDWEINEKFTLLNGLRMDTHNLIEGAVFNPRTSLLFKPNELMQVRLNYGTGFRAPQAFDTDLHIAFAGGGVSRVQLSPELEHERSQSFSASINYDKPTENMVYGFTLEGFYTNLDRAFILQPIGEDAFGEVFEKQNGQGAEVYGTTLELRVNYRQKLQLESGLTIQTSQFDNRVEYIEGVDGIRDFIRTPNEYGFANLDFWPTNRWNANVNYVFTGQMFVPHFAGAPNQLVDEIIESNSFHNVSVRAGYIFQLDNIQSEIEIYGGIRNVFDSFQDEFDIGKNRDSNFVFGPGLPRTPFVGVRLR